MIRYKNLNRDSGVSFFETGSDYIRVQFNTGKVYQYSYRRAGSYHVENMKALAERGFGLNGYIKHNVNEKYD